MRELDELYQQVILDHNRRPRNYGDLPGANLHADGHNRVCGDKVTVYLVLEDNVVKDIRFKGSGCAISTASASLMTESLKGKTLEEVHTLFDRFHALVTGQVTSREPDTQLGKLQVFGGVSEFPMRVKCATLVWHTMIAALKSQPETVSTE